MEAWLIEDAFAARSLHGPSLSGGADALQEGPDRVAEFSGPGAVHGMAGALDGDERGVGH